MRNELVARKYTSEIRRPLTQRAAFALEGIEVLSKTLVGEIERVSPGNTWGVEKEIHMRELSGHAQKIGEAEELNKDEIGLLSVVLRAHDLGRHIEALRGVSGKPEERLPGKKLRILRKKEEEEDIRGLLTN